MTLRQTICLLIAFFAGTSFITACMPQGGSQSKPVNELLITQNDLPSNWKSDGSPDRFGENYGQSSDLFVGFHNGEHIAWQLILVYSNAQTARENYHSLLPVFYNDKTSATAKPLFSPSGMDFASNVAQEFSSKCQRFVLGPNDVCVYMGLYDNKVVVFNTHMGSEVMLANDLERILNVIDKKMQN